MRRFVVAAIVMCAVAGHGVRSHAQEFEAKAGGGLIVARSPYRGVGTKAWAVPLAGIKYGPYFFQMGRAGAEVLTIADGVSLSLFLDMFAGARYSVDGKDLSAGYDNIKDRDSQLAAGVMVGWNTGWEDVHVSGSIAFGEEGNNYELSLSRPEVWNRGELVVIPKLSIGMLDGYYSRYYFGVSQREADENIRIDEPYQPGEVLTLGSSVYASYKLTERWSVMGMLAVEWMNAEARRSPIVDSTLLFAGMLGATYEF